MEPGTHLPNVYEAVLKGESPTQLDGGAYVWGHGNLITLYHDRDQNLGVIVPTANVLYLRFGKAER